MLTLCVSKLAPVNLPNTVAVVFEFEWILRATIIFVHLVHLSCSKCYPAIVSCVYDQVPSGIAPCNGRPFLTSFNLLDLPPPTNVEEWFLIDCQLVQLPYTSSYRHHGTLGAKESLLCATFLRQHKPCLQLFCKHCIQLNPVIRR